MKAFMMFLIMMVLSSCVVEVPVKPVEVSENQSTDQTSEQGPADTAQNTPSFEGQDSNSQSRPQPQPEKGQKVFLSFNKAGLQDGDLQVQRGVDAITQIDRAALNSGIFDKVDKIQEFDPNDGSVDMDTILDRINHYKENLTKDDTFVLYSHSHGTKSRNGREGGLLLGPRQIFSWSEYAKLITEIPTKKVIVFTMACYSGLLIDALNEIQSSWSSREREGRSFIVISVTSNSLPSGPVEVNGEVINPLTYSLIKAFEGESDLNNDGKISLDELSQYVMESTEEINPERNTADPQVVKSYQSKEAL